jgi:nicotine blue oxidoreductase
MRIAALLLAAGEGRRIGRPKALLPCHGSTFLATCAKLLAQQDVETVIAILGASGAAVRAAVHDAGDEPIAVDFVLNPDHRRGMLSSIRLGLDAAQERGADAVMIHPVDHPLVGVETVRRVVRALQSGATIAIPSFAGRRGHPAGFSERAWQALRAAAPDEGARAVLARHPGWIHYVQGDAGSISGINTAADYERLLGVALPGVPAGLTSQG